MSKKSILSKGFSNLLKSTEAGEAKSEKEIVSKDKKHKRSDTQTSKHLNVQTFKHSDVQENSNKDYSNSIGHSFHIEETLEVKESKAKYKTFKRCTLYLPTNIFQELNIEKIKSGMDLSELAAESIKLYLENKGYTF